MISWTLLCVSMEWYQLPVACGSFHERSKLSSVRSNDIVYILWNQYEIKDINNSLERAYLLYLDVSTKFTENLLRTSQLRREIKTSSKSGRVYLMKYVRTYVCKGLFFLWLVKSEFPITLDSVVCCPKHSTGSGPHLVMSPSAHAQIPSGSRNGCIFLDA